MGDATRRVVVVGAGLAGTAAARAALLGCEAARAVEFTRAGDGRVDGVALGGIHVTNVLGWCDDPAGAWVIAGTTVAAA